MTTDILKQKQKERFIVFLTSLASIGLIIANQLMGWEAWVPVVLLIMIVLLWAIHLSEKLNPDWKALFCFLTAFMNVFYFSVHHTSLFDIAAVVSMAMIAYTSFDRVYMMHAFLAEFFFLMP
ncbi:MAG TPA: hypothetical protein DCL38_04885 [Lachnospiraceae bacterium]|nr:hypothetical protein [Lachnospiraceae bacterium]